MTFQFGRKLELKVNLGRTTLAVNVTKLDMSFDIRLTGEEEPNTAVITVYNLRESTRNILSEPGSYIEFYGGYNNNLDLLFNGELTNLVHKQSPTGWVSTIYVGDGALTYKNTFFSKSYSAGTSVALIVSEMAESFGLDLAVEELPVGALSTGYTFHGPARTVMSDLLSDFEYTYTITHGVLEITKRGEPLLKDFSVVLINKENGLLLAPERTEIGVKVTTTLKGSLRPDKAVKIEAYRSTGSRADVFKKKTGPSAVDGVYRVSSVQHIGNNFGGPFDTISECEGE